jgi:DNA-binding NarL/FixJ family response regulator
MEFNMDVNIIKLSKREIEVCNLLLTGNCTNKIAELLNIKCNTVSTIKKSIFNKTKTSNLIELYEVYK